MKPQTCPLGFMGRRRRQHPLQSPSTLSCGPMEDGKQVFDFLSILHTHKKSDRDHCVLFWGREEKMNIVVNARQKRL